MTVQAEGRRMIATKRYRRILQLVLEVQVVVRELLARRKMQRFRKQVSVPKYTPLSVQ